MLRCSAECSLNPKAVSDVKTLRTQKTWSKPHQAPEQQSTLYSPHLCLKAILLFTNANTSSSAYFEDRSKIICNHRIHRSEAILIQHCTARTQQHPLPRHSYRSSGSEPSSTKTHGNILPMDQQAEAQGVLASRYYIHFVNKQS